MPDVPRVVLCGLRQHVRHICRCTGSGSSGGSGSGSSSSSRAAAQQRQSTRAAAVALPPAAAAREQQQQQHHSDSTHRSALANAGALALRWGNKTCFFIPVPMHLRVGLGAVKISMRLAYGSNLGKRVRGFVSVGFHVPWHVPWTCFTWHRSVPGTCSGLEVAVCGVDTKNGKERWVTVKKEGPLWKTQRT